MEQRSRTFEILVWTALGLTIACIVGAFAWKKLHPPAHALPVLGEVPDFALTNQQGQVVTKSQLKGQIWIGNIIFTRCPGPCARLSRQMAALQGKFAPSPQVRFISLSADPDNDTPAVLDKYARTHGADPARWQFLTGPKADINRLAVDGLKLALLEKDEATRESPNDLFIHSTVFALVDGKGRLRGFYEALEPAAIRQLKVALAALLQEKP